jgi:hypothetical protein
MSGAGDDALRRCYGEIVRTSLTVKAAVRRDFRLRAAVPVHRGDAVPKQAASRERAEWVSLVDEDRAGASASRCRLSQIGGNQDRFATRQNAVVLSTVHLRSGLEWDVVFLAG